MSRSAIEERASSDAQSEKLKSCGKLNLGNLKGETISLCDIKSRVIVLNFWSTWCLACKAEMPTLANLERQFEPEELQVVAILEEGDATQLQSFIKSLPKAELQLPKWRLIDTDGSVMRHFGVTLVPTTLLWACHSKLITIEDPQGLSHTERLVGMHQWDEPQIAAAIRSVAESVDCE